MPRLTYSASARYPSLRRICHSARLSLPPETATRMRSVGVNILNDLIARATCSCTKVVKQSLQKAALCRGRLITALVLHFPQFMNICTA